jgi:drug/metabolite transporter (DMT)-like permease
MVASSALFACMSALIKSVRDLPVWEIVFFRSVVNLAWFTPWAIGRLRSGRPAWQHSRRDLLSLLMRGVFGCLSMALYFYAISHLALADAVMLNYFSPIPTLVLSYFVLGERLSAKSVLFVCLALFGVGLILGPQFNVASLAGLAGFLSAFTAAVAYVSIKAATRRLSQDSIVFSFALISTLVSIIPAQRSFQSPSRKQLATLILVGLMATAAQKLMTRAYAGLPAHVVSPLSLLTVVFSAAFGWIFWGETPGIQSCIGASLVLMGLVGAYRSRLA